MKQWLKANISILILSVAILIHAFAVFHTPTNAGSNDVQKVKIVNQWNPVPVRIVE